MKRILILLLAVLISCSSNATKNEIKSDVQVEKETLKDSLNVVFEENCKLSELSENPEKFAGKKIIISGIFLGFSGSKCEFPETFSLQLTRSDWILQDNGLCIYVTSGGPDKLNPFKNDDIGKKVRIMCTVKKNKNDKIILEYLKNIY